MSISRRNLIHGLAGAAAASHLPLSAAGRMEDSESFKLGVASYSLRKLSRADAIKALKTLDVQYVNIKDFHLALKSTPEEIKQAKQEFNDAGITIIGVGNITFAKDDDAEMNRNFEYAKLLGVPVIVMAPTAQTVGKIEKLVQKFDIKAAIHNHGPEDKHYPAPQDVLKDIKNMDRRMGLCIDIGHTARTGTDVVQSIKQAGARVHDLHVKDLKNMTDKNSQVAVGDGAMPIPAIFKQLKAMKYTGGVMLEYEIEADNPLPGMQKSFAYMRGVLAGLRA